TFLKPAYPAIQNTASLVIHADIGCVIISRPTKAGVQHSSGLWSKLTGLNVEIPYEIFHRTIRRCEQYPFFIQFEKIGTFEKLKITLWQAVKDSPVIPFS